MTCIRVLNLNGRKPPKGFSQGKNKRIVIDVSDECFDLLRKQCELTGLSMAQVIRQFLPNMGM